MKEARCIIVDDEKFAQSILEQYISQVEGLTLVTKCSNALEAFNILQKESIDLVFLDIKMPQLSGLDLAKNIPSQTKIIFTTAFKEHALDSYELNAVDYLLKPISNERFLRSVSKFMQLHSQSYAPLLNDAPTIDNPYIFLRVNRQNVRVNLKDILYIEGLKDYVIVKTADTDYITYLKLNYLEAKLPASDFLRIHKSYIIALDKIKAYTTLDATLENNKEIPIGKTYQTTVGSLLKQKHLF